MSVGADVQFRIWDPVLSVMAVKDLNTATRMTAHNAMTKALLRRPLQEIQMEKLKIGDQLLVGDISRLLAHYMSQHYLLKGIWVRPQVEEQR